MTDRRFVRPGIQRVTTDTEGRWYEWDGQRYWSVTTILNVLQKWGLVKWAANTAARHAIDNYTAIGQMLAEGLEDEAYDVIRNAADEHRDRRADIGSAFHDYAEAWTLGEDRPTPVGELADLVDVFEDFVERMQPTFVMAEAPVFKRTRDITEAESGVFVASDLRPHYAGTLDAILELPWSVLDDEFLTVIYGEQTWDIAAERADDPDMRVSLVVDYTTAKNVYPEKGLQVTAYRWADFVGMPDGSTPPLPDTDGGAVLRVGVDGWELYPVDTGSASIRAFDDAAALFDWQKHHANGTIGKPVKVKERTT